MGRVSLCVSIISKFPLCDSRIGDNVKKRGWSLGWVLSGSTRVSKEKFSFLSGLEIQPKQTRRFIELSANEDETLNIVSGDPAFGLERILCKRRSSGKLLQESWSIDFQAFTVSASASASASVDAPSTYEDAARHAAIHFAISTCGRHGATRRGTTITPVQRRRICWHCAACFRQGYGKSKSWFALWSSGPWPERDGHESLSAGRGQVYRCHRFCVWVRRERSIHRKVFSSSVG